MTAIVKKQTPRTWGVYLVKTDTLIEGGFFSKAQAGMCAERHNKAHPVPLQAYEAGGVYVDGGPFGGFYWAASQEDAMAQAQADMCTNSERTDEEANYACLLTDQIATMVSFLADGPQP